jgi:3-oxoacyl-[acyl-carrier protein] reductase
LFRCSKAAAPALARALAPDVGVNAVAPGVVESTWMVSWTEESRKRSIENTPLRRWCTTADIAEAIVYLGFHGSMITGQTLIIDGGLSI